jgi:hypothetical protein
MPSFCKREQVFHSLTVDNVDNVGDFFTNGAGFGSKSMKTMPF